jgi:hypothetical protein
LVTVKPVVAISVLQMVEFAIFDAVEAASAEHGSGQDLDLRHLLHVHVIGRDSARPERLTDPLAIGRRDMESAGADLDVGQEFRLGPRQRPDHRLLLVLESDERRRRLLGHECGVVGIAAKQAFGVAHQPHDDAGLRPLVDVEAGKARRLLLLEPRLKLARLFGIFDPAARLGFGQAFILDEGANDRVVIPLLGTRFRCSQDYSGKSQRTAGKKIHTHNHVTP